MLPLGAILLRMIVHGYLSCHEMLPDVLWCGLMLPDVLCCGLMLTDDLCCLQAL